MAGLHLSAGTPGGGTMGRRLKGNQLPERGPWRKRDRCDCRSKPAQARSLRARNRYTNSVTGQLGGAARRVDRGDESALLPGGRDNGVGAASGTGNLAGLNEVREAKDLKFIGGVDQSAARSKLRKCVFGHAICRERWSLSSRCGPTASSCSIVRYMIVSFVTRGLFVEE